MYMLRFMNTKTESGIVASIIVALLLCCAPAFAKNERIPTVFFGVTLGVTNFDDGAALLESQGWEADVEDGDEDDEDDHNLYIFISGADKAISYRNINWYSAMFVTGDRKSMVIEDISFMTTYISESQATRIFGTLARQFRKEYKNYISKDSSEQLVIRQGDNYIGLSLRNKSNGTDSWYVILIVHIKAGNAFTETAAPPVAQPVTATSGSSSSVFGSTLPHSLLGVEIGKTKLSGAMKVLKKKGFSPELDESGKQHITVRTSDKDVTIFGHKITLANFYFNNPLTKACTGIYCAILFESGSDARDFIRATKEELVAKYPGCTSVDEQNYLLLQQDGYYLSVEREYLEETGTWIGVVAFSNTPPD